MKGKTAILGIVIILAIFAGTSWAAVEGSTNTAFGNNAGNNMIGSGTFNFGLNADTFIGAGAGITNSTGSYNSFIGAAAGYWNEVGDYNSFLGYQAGATNSGSYNSFLGYQAGLGNTTTLISTGSYNSFLGTQAGYSNTTGNYNSFLGYQAGYSSLGTGGLTGSNNSFLGAQAGYSNTTGNYNNFLGYQAGYSNTTGNYNSFLGTYAGTFNTSGSFNSFLGYEAGSNNTSGNYNSYLGYDAGLSNNTGSGNVFLGYQAGFSETLSNRLYIDNCFTGDPCEQPLIYGEFDNRIVKINGTLTVAGSGGIKFPDGTTQTTALKALSAATNSFFGQAAGSSNPTGSNNTFVGSNAGEFDTTGYRNTFVGSQAGIDNMDGHFNTFIGDSAGHNNTSGVSNTIIGVQAGYSISGSGNVIIGNSAGYSETGSNKLYIDNCYTGGNCTNPLIYGEFDNGVVKINGTLFMTSDERLKRNIEPLKSSLEKVMHLQGVSYEWKVDENPRSGLAKNREVGLIAQDVEAVIPELVHTDSQGYKALAYDKMVPVLIEAIKEQQKEIKEKDAHYTASLQEKDARIERLEKALALMEERLAATESPTKTIALK